MRKAIITFMVLTITVFSVSPAVHAEVSPFNNDVEIIEGYLEEENTDVKAELDELRSEYAALLHTLKTKEEVDKVNDLIKTLDEITVDYEDSLSRNPNSRLPGDYAPAVAAVIAYFNANGYKLSSELLVHMRSNSSVGSTYVPTYGYYVQSSAVFRNISRGGSISGTAAFPNSGTTRERDLYYGIHNFYWRKSSAGTRTVKITDLYDYAKSNEYTGVAGVAVNTMYAAQQAGYLTKYYVNITASAD